MPAASHLARGEIRRDWVAGELAALRVPDLSRSRSRPKRRRSRGCRTLARVRVDVAESTRVQHRSAVARCACRCSAPPRRRDHAPDVAELVAELAREGSKPQTIRKTVAALAMVLDHAGVDAEPGPRQGDGEAAARGARRDRPADRRARRCRPRAPADPLPAAAARARRDRACASASSSRSRGATSTSRAAAGASRRPSRRPAGRGGSRCRRSLFEAVLELVPRDDRAPERRVFQGFGGDRFRTAITRACTAAGVPTFSPHDLRHRRISLLHLAGVPWARIGEHVGHATSP